MAGEHILQLLVTENARIDNSNDRWMVCYRSVKIGNIQDKLDYRKQERWDKNE